MAIAVRERMAGGAAFVTLVVAAVAGAGALVAFAPQHALALLGYAVAVLVGFVAVRAGGARTLLTPLVLLVTVAPRTVQTNNGGRLITITESIGGLTGGQLIALLCVATLGGTGALPLDRRERLAVVGPLLLFGVGVTLVPDLLLDPSLGWLSSMGAIYVLSRRWQPALLGAPLIALIIGAASIQLLIPGWGAGVAVLPSGIRAFGVFGNSLMAAITISLLAALVIATARPKLLVSVALLGVATWASVETGSRTGLLMVGLLLVSMALGLFPQQEVRRPTIGRKAWLAIGAGCAVLWFLDHREDLGRVGSLSQSEGSWVARLAGLRDGVGDMVTHPVGGLEVVVYSAAGRNSTFENMFLDAGARMGWFPLLGLMVAFVMVFRLGGGASRAVVGIVILVGFTTTLYFFPAPFIVGLIAAGAASPARSDGRAPVERTKLAQAAAQR